ncbi:asparaginase [Pseudonocardia thermophila]|uniref:Asparaginase n=1 Tax=Pseudonocardia thermophila TaxID=1848 RepID=A0A1M6YHR3_PSETH|nr:asparaginase [Pseudonocardia thermophila]
MRAGVLARVVRGGFVESVHLGHAVARDGGGRTVWSIGDPATTFLPRSALKPVQAVAMLEHGLDLSGELLALAAASHSGEPAHRAGVAGILAGAGFAEADLQNTPALPWDAQAAFAWRAAGRGPEPIAQNCSGKHAAMLATCVAAGWDPTGYRDPGHPLQRAVRAAIARLTGDGDPAVTTVDGCGAPLFSCTVAGLAEAFARIAAAAPDTAEGRVAAAMRAHPWWVSGTGRLEVELAAAVPGAIGKIGAEGVFAAALPDGRALAVKVLDGAARPLPVVVAAALRALGETELGTFGEVPVLGHGVPVGRLEL